MDSLYNHSEMAKTIYYVPVGGLGNRMQALVAAYNLHQATGIRVRVLWFRDWALDAPFSSIFQPICQEGFVVKDATPFDSLLYDRPRRHNLYVPLLPQRLLFSRRIRETQTVALKAQGFDFERWAREAKGNVYFACYESFGNVSDSLYDDLLRLSTTVEQKLQTITGGFSDHTIGLHIRRTDNYRSIAQSPLYLFENKIKEEIEKNPDTCVFLATDDEPTKKTLTAEFPGRILTSSKAAERGTVDGIQDALAEMYALASCERIYGSAGSSFSIIASKLKQTPLCILKNA